MIFFFNSICCDILSNILIKTMFFVNENVVLFTKFEISDKKMALITVENLLLTLMIAFYMHSMSFGFRNQLILTITSH